MPKLMKTVTVRKPVHEVFQYIEEPKHLPEIWPSLYEVKAVELKGTITMFEWTNPHNQIHFDVTDATGKVTSWIAATEPPQVMLERGWTRRSLKAGDQVTAYVFVAKNGAPVGNLQRIVLADGKQLGTGGGAPPPAAAPPPPTK